MSDDTDHWAEADQQSLDRMLDEDPEPEPCYECLVGTYCTEHDSPR